MRTHPRPFKSLAMTVGTFAAAMALQMPAQAVILTFDELGVPSHTNPSGPVGFASQGYEFSTNMDVVDVSATGGNWSLGVGQNHSGAYAALNDWGGPMIMTQVGGGTFSVGALSLNGWEGLPGEAIIEGRINGTTVQTVAAGFGFPWSVVTLNMDGIDTLVLSANHYFLVDDIGVNVSAVPEPETGALMLAGLASLALLAGHRPKRVSVPTITLRR